MHHRFKIAFAVLLAASIPGLVQANARLINVAPLDGGCVSGPVGNNVQSWDVQAGRTYRLTIDQVTNCANGGTDATINIRVNNSATGNVDLVATKVSTGVYTYDVQMPANACATSPMFYCTSPGQSSTGTRIGRNDTGNSQAHLRASTFGAGCSSPSEVGCPVPVAPVRWGGLKALYR